MTLEHLYKKLEDFSDFNDEDNLIPFIETVEEIVSYKDPSCFPIIMRYFDDETDYDWIMQSMIHALESFPDDVYVKTFMLLIPFMWNHAPNWLLILICRILNNISCLNSFKKNISLISTDTMKKILDLVAQEFECHKKLCAKLKKSL